MEPVELYVERRCRFVRKGCGVCGKAKSNPAHRGDAVRDGSGHKFGRKLGCATCGLAMNHADHVGAPESFNLFASGSWEAYQTAKKRWHEVLAPLLEASDLPRPCDRITVEGVCSFGDPRPRDQGNHRVVIEKALGDVLVESGFLPADTWDRYEFGGLARREDGTNSIRLLLFPTPPELVTLTIVASDAAPTLFADG